MNNSTISPLMTYYKNCYQADNRTLQIYNFSGNQFAKAIEKELNILGYNNIQHRIPIAGFEVDLAVIEDNQTFAIDLVGFSGAMERAFPPDKHQMLQRIGIPVFVIPHSKWLVNPKRCLDELEKFLETPK